MRVFIRQINPKKQEDSLLLLGESEDNLAILMESGYYGKKRALSPMQLLLLSLGGCTGMDVISILNKMKSPPEEFTMEIEGERAAEHPKVYTKIKIRYRFRGVPRDKAEKAVKLSMEKYCSVSAMLRKGGVEIIPEIVVE